MNTDLIKEQKQPRFTFFQILEGIKGIAIIIACYLTFFLKPLRDRWGLSKKEVKRALTKEKTKF